MHTVDPSPALRRLLIELQIWCSADCCKADAFRISEEAVGRWLDGERIDRTRELAAEITAVERDLRDAEGQVLLAARGLESQWGVQAFQTFWTALTGAFASAVAARSGDAERGAALNPARHIGSGSP